VRQAWSWLSVIVFLEVGIGMLGAGIGCASGAQWPDDTLDEQPTIPVISIPPPGYDAYAFPSCNGGISVYRRAEREWIAVVDLSRARVRNLIGKVQNAASGYGAVDMHAPETFWKSATGDNDDTHCAAVVVSGTYGEWQSWNGLAFGLQRDFKLISYGYASPGGPSPEPQFDGMIKLLAVDSETNGARIEMYSRNVFDQFSDVIGGLAGTADKFMNLSLGRTFAGLRDENGDGTYETLLLYSSDKTTQAHAMMVLQEFGAAQTIMLIGGDAAFLYINGVSVVNGELDIPHAIGIFGHR